MNTTDRYRVSPKTRFPPISKKKGSENEKPWKKRSPSSSRKEPSSGGRNVRKPWQTGRGKYDDDPEDVEKERKMAPKSPKSPKSPISSRNASIKRRGKAGNDDSTKEKTVAFFVPLDNNNNNNNDDERRRKVSGRREKDDDDDDDDNRFKGEDERERESRFPPIKKSREILYEEEKVDKEDALKCVVRVRPLNMKEKDRGEKSVLQYPQSGAITVDYRDAKKSFAYDITFEPKTNQSDIFEHSGIKKLIEMAVDGYSCTAFAYGQTGSGKTYTMTGPPDEQREFDALVPDDETGGIVPRAFQHLLQEISQRENTRFRITAQYLEIYNEKVRDLLRAGPDNSSRLVIRWSNNRGFYVENLFEVQCDTIEDLMIVLQEGIRNRATGSNNINEHSSRSHSLLVIHVQSQETTNSGGGRGEGGGKEDEDDEEEKQDRTFRPTKHGKLTFVDLAGSEANKGTTKFSKGHIREASNINKSLLVLGLCISALSSPRKRKGHIPYRDSNLTKLLADDLQGKGVALMITCISPSSSHVSETLSSLRYADQAKKIKLEPIVIMDPREQFIVSLRREIKILRQENLYLRQQLDFPVQPRGLIQKENDSMLLALVEKQKTTFDRRTQRNPALIEMLHEYMIENEILRKDNLNLHTARETTRKEVESLTQENTQMHNQLDKMADETNSCCWPHSASSSSSSSSKNENKDNKKPEAVENSRKD